MESALGLLLIVVFALVFYFMPTIVAANRGHRNTLAIGIANLFFGWTFIGWVLCLVWACTK
jgi:hypothetical protein